MLPLGSFSVKNKFLKNRVFQTKILSKNNFNKIGGGGEIWKNLTEMGGMGYGQKLAQKRLDCTLQVIFHENCLITPRTTFFFHGNVFFF